MTLWRLGGLGLGQGGLDEEGFDEIGSGVWKPCQCGNGTKVKKQDKAIWLHT